MCKCLYIKAPSRTDDDTVIDVMMMTLAYKDRDISRHMAVRKSNYSRLNAADSLEYYIPILISWQVSAVYVFHTFVPKS